MVGFLLNLEWVSNLGSDEDEMGVLTERSSQVFDLMRSGYRAFRASKFEEVR